VSDSDEPGKQFTQRMRVDAGIERTRILRIEAENRNFTFETFDNDVSFRLAKRTLQGESYPAIPFLSDVAGVLDIGANIGASAVTFAIRYPSARIVAVEPSRQPFILLRSNTSAHAKIECYNVGLFGSTMKGPLFRGGPDSVTNSVIPNRDTRTAHEEIQLIAADAFVDQIGMTRPDIIKIDTEGCELPIISSIVESFRAAKVVYLEYHNENDRRVIDQVFVRTHILFSGKIRFPHRGELVYVRNDAFPTQSARDRWRIGT
jgi:FkbM family methyltransferase